MILRKLLLPQTIYGIEREPVTGLLPAGTASFGADSFTITGTTNMTSASTDWTAGKLVYILFISDW